MIVAVAFIEVPYWFAAQANANSQLDQSIDLVLTDPPYFDDVQYAELASLFLAWAQAVQTRTVDYIARPSDRSRGESGSRYWGN